VSEVTSAQAMEVAKTIMSQLGMRTRWELGVKSITAVTDKLGGVELLLGGLSITAGKRVRIVLDYSDTYDVEVYRVTGGRFSRKTLSVSPIKKKIYGKYSDVYCDTLSSVVLGIVFEDLVRAKVPDDVRSPEDAEAIALFNHT